MRHRTKEPVVLVFTRDIYWFYGSEHRWCHPSILRFNRQLDTKPGTTHGYEQHLARRYDVRSGFEPFLASMAFAFVVLLATAIWIIKTFHGRSWTEVINGTKRVRWSRFFVGLAVWGTLLIVSFVISYMTDPDNFEFRFDPVRFILLTIISLTMLPIQSSCEEFVFRGYLAQGVASWTGSRLWALLIPSVLFALLHSANPEVAKYGFGVMMANYFLIGLTFGLISLLDDGIELAMGAHSINNILGSMLMTYEGSALRTDALFKAKIINPGEDLFIAVISSIVFIGILAFIYKWKFGILTRRVPPPPPSPVLS